MTHFEMNRLESLLKKLDGLDISDADYIQIGLLLKSLEILNDIKNHMRVQK